MKKTPLKKEVVSALVLTFLLFAGLGAWLYVEAPKTLALREAQLPVIKSLVTLTRSDEAEVVAPPPAEEVKEETKPVDPSQPTDIHVDEVPAKSPLPPTKEALVPEEETPPVAPDVKEAEKEIILEGTSLIPADMVDAPLTDLIEPKPVGDLPLVGMHGDKAWHMYGRLVDTKDKKQISIIVNNVGMSKEMLMQVLQNLPNTVNLAFNPYVDDVDELILEARKNKFEPLLLAPMEPNNYPNNDPGPQALLSNVSQTQNLEHLYWILSRGTGYVGLMNYMGSDFLKNKEAMEPVFKDLNKRGLVFVDTLAGTGHSLAEGVAVTNDVPYVTADLIIDEYPVKIEIEKQLRALEILAGEFGSAVGVMNPLPLSIETVATWAKRLQNQNIALVPLSNIIERRMKKEEEPQDDTEQ